MSDDGWREAHQTTHLCARAESGTTPQHMKVDEALCLWVKEPILNVAAVVAKDVREI